MRPSRRDFLSVLVGTPIVVFLKPLQPKQLETYGQWAVSLFFDDGKGLTAVFDTESEARAQLRNARPSDVIDRLELYDSSGKLVQKYYIKRYTIA